MEEQQSKVLVGPVHPVLVQQRALHLLQVQVLVLGLDQPARMQAGKVPAVAEAEHTEERIVLAWCTQAEEQPREHSTAAADHIQPAHTEE